MTWTAGDVLDTYADLIRRLRRPSPAMANFTAFHMNRALRQDHKRTQFYPVIPAAGRSVTDQAGAEFANFLGTSLVGAPVYQITEDMCEAIEAMYAKTVAEATPAIYEANLPAAAGFAWLDKPLELEVAARPGNPSVEDVYGVSWALQTVNYDTGPASALRVAIWTLAGCMRDDAGTKSTPMEVTEIRDVLGEINLMYTDVYVIDSLLAAPGVVIPQRSAVALIAYVNMLWMMLQMEITGVDRATGTRGARRRAEPVTGKTDVQVVTLRRAHHGDRGDPPGEHRAVDWSGRWIVQTHYRHHVAPPRATWHQALPAADKRHCAVCGAEVSYIPAYVKGPAGARIITRRKLNRL